VQPQWEVIDATIALSGPDDRWRFALLGKNLGDESYSTNLLPGGTQRGVPRDDETYYGLTARWKF
jgi:outer membrane receptor protein involved in Fe transport